MKEVVLLRGAEVRKILQAVMDKKIPAMMCYLSRSKWHKAQVLVVNLESDAFDVKVVRPGSEPEAFEGSNVQHIRPHPVNVMLGQSVGISIKYEEGKSIFDSPVIDFGVSSVQDFGGIITLENPGQMEVISRRSFFRVRVPEKLCIAVKIWHRRCCGFFGEGHRHFEGRLVDISAGGLQVAVTVSQRPDFHKGQFVKVSFCPLHSEVLLEFSAQIRNILPTADGESVCFGLQAVGLEASRKGREILSRLAGVTELYYELNRGCSVSQRSTQAVLHTRTYVKQCRSEWGDLLCQ